MTDNLTVNEVVNVFINFLVKHEAHLNFMHALDIIPSNTLINLTEITEILIGHFKTLHISYYESIIDDSFTWAETKEGAEYWSSLNAGWEEYINMYLDSKFKNLKSIW